MEGGTGEVSPKIVRMPAELSTFVRAVFYSIRLAIQAGSAWALGVVYYLVGIAAAVYEGAESLVGQPVVGLFLSGAAVGMLFVVGLPIRLIPSLHRRWLRMWWLPPVLGMMAVGCTLLSWQPAFQTTVIHPELQVEVPCFNLTLGYAGWLLAIFAALHFYLPLPLDRMADWIARCLRRCVGDGSPDGSDLPPPPPP